MYVNNGGLDKGIGVSVAGDEKKELVKFMAAIIAAGFISGQCGWAAENVKKDSVAIALTIVRFVDEKVK